MYLSVSSDDVKGVFETVGVVKKAFVKFDDDGKSTGEAVVTFCDSLTATKAVKTINGCSIDGVEIEVSYSIPKWKMRGRGRGRGRGVYKNISWVRKS